MSAFQKTKKVKRTVRGLFSLHGSETRVSVTSPHRMTLRHWRFVLLQTRHSLASKKTGVLSAGVAYYATQAFFPMIVAVLAVAAYVIDGDDLGHILNAIDHYLPHDIGSLLAQQLQNALGHSSRNGAVALIAISLTLFSVSRATHNLVKATNTIYEREETRPTLRLYGISLLLTVGVLIVGVIVVSLLLVTTSTFTDLGVPVFVTMTFPYIRWIILALVIAGSLAAFYRYAPNNKRPHWQWVSWGAGIATLVWLIGTTLFFIYTQNFANLSNLYSLFAGIIVLMIWFNLSAYIVLLGAEINHRLESRTTRRTTLD